MTKKSNVLSKNKKTFTICFLYSYMLYFVVAFNIFPVVLLHIYRQVKDDVFDDIFELNNMVMFITKKVTDSSKLLNAQALMFL